MNRRLLVVSSSIGVILLGAFAGCTIKTGGDGDAGTTGVGGTTLGTGGSVGTGGGVSTGGSAGTGGTTGTGGTAGADAGMPSGSDGGDAATLPIEAGSDPCTSPDPVNEDRDHATPYPLNADFPACLQTGSDIDFYEFTTPASPAGGGVVTINLTQVGTAGGVESTAYVTTDNGEVAGNFAGEGTSVAHWFSAVASTRYRVRVISVGGQGATANPYLFKASYLEVNDTYEPNDTRAQAKTITLGAAVHGYFFAGFATSTGPTDAAWDDWYKITLAAGSAQISITNVPASVSASFELYDSSGTIVQGTAIGNNEGASLTATRTGLVAGDYTLKVTPFNHPTLQAHDAIAPDNATQAYTLTVTQP